jgi:hypothetical protein
MNLYDERAGERESLTHEVKAIVGGPAAKAFNLQHHLLTSTSGGYARARSSRQTRRRARSWRS